jgi:hypothetical protein
VGLLKAVDMKICRESFVHLNFTIALVFKALTELRRVKDGGVGLWVSVELWFCI